MDALEKDTSDEVSTAADQREQQPHAQQDQQGQSQEQQPSMKSNEDGNCMSPGENIFRKKQLREAFDTADKNKDGVISSKEMEDFLKERGVRVSRTTSLKNRLRPRRKMTFEKFCSKIYRSQNIQNEKMTKMEQHRALFKFLDENGDGLITKAEIRERMRLSGQNLTDEQVDQMVKLGDKNNDEQIDFDEFVELMKLLQDGGTSSSGESDTDNFFRSAITTTTTDEDEEESRSDLSSIEPSSYTGAARPNPLSSAFKTDKNKSNRSGNFDVDELDF